MAEKQYCSYEQVSWRLVFMHLGFDGVTEREVEAAGSNQGWREDAAPDPAMLLLSCRYKAWSGMLWWTRMFSGILSQR